MKTKLENLRALALRQQARIAGGAVGALALAAPAVHAAIDVTAVTGELGDAKTAVLAIGVAVLGIFVGIMLYKWIKKAL